MILALELLFRIMVASICGIVIGFERQAHFKVAGVKTHMIVGFSSALIMVVSKYGFIDGASADASRIAAQVVSGIGFLGAGIIFKKNQSVQGLTTAAGILATSGLGLALGAGLYIVGIFGTLILLLLRLIVQNIEKFQNNLQESFAISFDDVDSLTRPLSLCDTYKVISYSIEIKQNIIKMYVTMLFSDEKEKQQWISRVMSHEKVVKFENY